MFEEDEFAAGFQDPSNAANSFSNVGNCAQRKSANHSIDRVVVQRDAFSRKVQKFDIELGLASLRICQTNHSSIGVERVDLVYSCGIVVGRTKSSASVDAPPQTSIMVAEWLGTTRSIRANVVSR